MIPEGAATGVGSLPGTDIVVALRLVLDELPDLPHLPELPARGPGADTIGRSAGLLVDLPVELYAGRWRTAAHTGRDARRTADLWERDLDALTDAADGFTGTLKLQCAGVWTLAAAIDRPIGGAVLRDPGAVRDLTASLAEGVAAHVAGVSRRVPGATLLVQLDEPSLPAVLAGQVPTESGLHMYRAIEPAPARDALAQVISAAGAPVVVHCCAPDAPIGLVRDAGAAGVGLDLDLLKDLDPLGELLEAGGVLLAGALPPTGAAAPPSAQVADRVGDVWRRLGFPVTRLPGQVVVTPACGMAGATPEYARGAYRSARDAGRRLLDLAHE
ncbi:MAG: methionine synthase [Micromonosporaceae bacterium]|nr:methionine synthase [Micromonosporaceae bacterium]